MPVPAHLFSASLFGFDCKLVDIEVDVLNGPSSITIVGLGDASVQESKERIRSAIKNSGADYPRRQKTINLAPADLRKHGPMFDLPISLGLLLQSEQIPEGSLKDTLVIGELSLNGNVRRVSGILPIVDFAKKEGFLRVIIPEENAVEASFIGGIEIIAVSDLRALISHLRRETVIAPYTKKEGTSMSGPDVSSWDFMDIQGHENIKRALTIAAAGHHNVLLYGPPGSGKTMLARSLSSILPPLTFEESIEVTKIYSIAGRLPAGDFFISYPPFRGVHHTASTASLIGGGTIPRPGEISLAHRGVLFLDELLEFPRGVLDALRQPMEDGFIRVHRAAGSSLFPANFMLVAATNPCPCGFAQDPIKQCKCTPSQQSYYWQKLSGPLLDRIDIVCYVPRIIFNPAQEREDVAAARGTSSDARIQVETARRIQHLRGSINGNASPTFIKEKFHLTKEALELLHQASQRFHHSGRVVHKLMKVARTIADIEHCEQVEMRHIAEALQYRERQDLP